MVLLIGGYSCTGKTLLSHRLMEELKVPYFSIDYLKMGLYRSDESCGFTPMDSDDHIARIFWPIVEEMIYTYIENGQDMIIEGCYIMPEAVNEIEAEYQDEVKSIFLGFSDKYINENFDSKIIANKGVIEKRKPEDERPISQFIENHLSLKSRAEKAGLYFHEIDEDYEKEMDNVIKMIKEFYTE